MFSECHVFEPPNKVNKFYYKCDKVFHLEDLLKLYVEHDTYAIVLISGKRTDIYSYSQNSTKFIKSIKVELPNQHKTGGSSAPRMGRIRDEKIGMYIKTASELLFKQLVKENIFQHLGLFVAGPGELKNQLQQDHLFVQHFQKHLLQVVTISEITERSVYDVIDVVSGSLYGDKVNTQILENFESLLLDDYKMNLLVFGIKEIFEQSDELEEIFIDEDSLHLLDGIILGKVKVTIMHDTTFVKKYGAMVGIRYYVRANDDEDNISEEI
jgi:peptide subunit release factor 1 (eRF1)